MPKVDIDYSNTIIYKIACTDMSVTDIYVGHTTNFVQRKYSHKQNCNNIKSPCYNLKLYKTIRDNGNWSNWNMTIINFYNCKNLLEAKQKEHEYFISLNATLNSVDPLPFKDILQVNKISKNTNNDRLLELPLQKFSCSTCNYYTSNKKDWGKHINTEKHINNTALINSKITVLQNIKEYKCQCGNIYKHRSSLSFHKKKCVIKNTEVTDKQLIILLLKQNAELIEQNSEFLKNINSNNNKYICA